MERANVPDQEVVCVGPEVILDEVCKVGIHVQKGSILVPGWPCWEELRGTLVWIKSVDEGKVVGTESGSAVI